MINDNITFVNKNTNSGCHAYITGYEYNNLWSDTNHPPKPLTCDSPYGVWRTHVSYEKSSCCSDEGVYFVETSQSGGFDFGYERPDETLCQLYATAMSGLVCHPDQGRFVVSGSNESSEISYTLRVCQSSCQLLFDNCGLPGENFPQWTTYTDAISLCEEAWGGFVDRSYGEDEGPCLSRPEGFVCRSGIDRVEVVPDDRGEKGGNCLGFVPPMQDEIDEYLNSFDGYSHSVEYQCVSTSTNTVIIVMSVVGTAVLFCGLCLGYLVCRSRRKEKDADPLEQSMEEQEIVVIASPIDDAGTYGGEVPSSNVKSSVPAVMAVPLVSTKPSAPPLGEENASNSFTEASSSAVSDNMDDSVQLTFEQRINLRELEGKLKLEMLTQEDFNRMRRDILS